MGRIFFQVVMVVIALGLFFGFVDKVYRGVGGERKSVKELQVEIAKYDDALAKAKDIVKKRDELQQKSNIIDNNDKQRLNSLLPDSIDNIRLVYNIDQIVKNYGLTTRNLKFEGETAKDSGSSSSNSSSQRANTQSQRIAVGGNDVVGTVSLSFSVTTDYQTLKRLLYDLEDSLRLIDVTSLAIKPTQDGGFNDFSITLKTYWLK